MTTVSDSPSNITYTDRIITIKAKPHKYNTPKNIATMEAVCAERSLSYDIIANDKVLGINSNNSDAKSILKPMTSESNLHIQSHTKEKAKTLILIMFYYFYILTIKL